MQEPHVSIETFLLVVSFAQWTRCDHDSSTLPAHQLFTRTFRSNRSPCLTVILTSPTRTFPWYWIMHRNTIPVPFHGIFFWGFECDVGGQKHFTGKKNQSLIFLFSSFPSSRFHKLLFCKHMTLRMKYDLKPYLCIFCPYAFAKSSKLFRHMRTHTGEKPNACSLCSYAAATKSDLTLHMRTHTGIKPYGCTQCPFASTNKGHLTVHMRTHTGEKPYACSLCSFAAATKSDLTVHMRTHTGEMPRSKSLT